MNEPDWIDTANDWFPRIAGSLSFISAAYMIVMAWDRRQFLVHSLVLGMAIYQLIFSICLIVGSAAAPYSTVHVDGRGTIGTCTAQGFLLYVGLDGVHLYYCMFSFYFYAAIKNNFDL